ncbi:shikimate dehydrogenase [Desulforamulus ruminis]|uniref:Shikimate dehydrogenase (NADP(+)) n=1 Tax=Desulforamulus ruminis (strain ATCC 23193 / DSM 2154 / NCIMB 8452 / DL) TaxID=696281 RepID=F6DUE3_DESRL|nr:shikimate dehydrogenase [Desulforamulus ruminis]AEG61328.1 shikimate 5-dehydrogenase [Desulforamulus ruminis DSM 2154]
MGFPALNGKTKICGLFGFPVEHSFSPAMHNAAFEELGLNWVYVPFCISPDRLKQAMQSITSLGLTGINVTVPHKQAVLPLLDEIHPTAGIIGAVNTIVNDQGRLVGHNTDGAGFVKSLTDETGFSPRGQGVLILGAGGAARAVAVQLALSGAGPLYIANRSPAKAEALARDLQQATGVRAAALPWGRELPQEKVNEVGLVVQTTPMGMAPKAEQCPDFPFQAIRTGQVVCDLIYNPGQTLFLKEAAVRGAVPLNGLGMLLYQGVLAFELWTGKTAPVAVMREALLRQVSKAEE